MARKIGIQISGVCSFLFWPYAFTHQDPERRKKGVELAGQMIRAARLLGTENLLVVPGSVYAPWIPEEPPVPHDVALERATAAVKSLIPAAAEAPGLPQHGEHFCQRLFAQPAGDERLRRWLCTATG